MVPFSVTVSATSAPAAAALNHQGVLVVLAIGVQQGRLVVGVEEILIAQRLDLVVQPVQQGGVALDHGDADVDLTGVYLKIVLAAGEVQNHQIVVGGTGAHSGGHIGADEVDSAGLKSHEH